MALDDQQIKTWFSIPEISDMQKTAFKEVVEASLVLAETINQNMPDGEDKAQVINSLRQDLLTVELAIRYRFQPNIRLAKGVS